MESPSSPMSRPPASAGTATPGTPQRGTGLYVSIVLRMAQPLPAMMLALGLAARRGHRDDHRPRSPIFAGPTMFCSDGRKCAGVLAQLEGGAVIAGIGINVSQTEFPG